MTSSLSLCNNEPYFLIGLWCVMKSGFYTPTGNDQLSGWTKKKLQSTSQSQTYTKKRLWSLFDGLLAIWPTTAFWILVKPLHLRSMLSKSMRHTENCNARSQHWSTERAQWFSMTTADHISHNLHFKRWTNLGYGVLPPPPYSPDLSSTDYHFFEHLDYFCREMHPQSVRGRKCFPRVHQIPKHECLCFKNNQTYFSLAKMWLQ